MNSFFALPKTTLSGVSKLQIVLRIHPEDPKETKTGTVKTTNNRTDTEAIKMEIIITNKELTKQEMYFYLMVQPRCSNRHLQIVKR